jgi:Mn2+/Fe2+ NRAMP family transporter
VMGRFVNGRASNVLSYGMVAILILLTLILLLTTVFPRLTGSG